MIDGADLALDAIEREPVDKKHRPIKDVLLNSVSASGHSETSFCVHRDSMSQDGALSEQWL